MIKEYDKFFDYVSLGIASKERILEMSYGAVTKTETINYRTFRAEPEGLFCEKIFGPSYDWHCYCGKYKRIKYRGTICDRCGVEVTLSKVRRERMGHIRLVAPVVHIWFLKGTPSGIATLLGMSMRDLERVTYYECYIVTDPGETDLQPKQLLSATELEEALDEYGSDFEYSIGAEAVKQLLEEVDLEQMSLSLRESVAKTTSQQVRGKLAKYLAFVEAMRKSDNEPSWMVLDVLPVLPPELRPLVPLDGGRFASSDLNDLYRRVINRNNRLAKLIELDAPEVIIRNEKRMLQESVDCLFDNGRRGRPVVGVGNRPFKSLSDMLKGKQGRFRQNLLGKRVDYSGRSVIVVGPKLKLHQCGLPKQMALELFEPFIIRKMKERGFLHTLKLAKTVVGKHSEEVYDILEEITSEHPVLLNRAPTLHRLGIQAFEPVLVDGNALHLHPLVCTAYNADFDGDQMAVHVPLSVEAQVECRVLMLASNNLFSPASGEPIVTPSQDIILGIYYATMGLKDEERKPFLVDSADQLRSLVEGEFLDIHHPVLFHDGRFEGIVHKTTAGRVLFNALFPTDLEFFNETVGKKELSSIIASMYKKCGHEACVHFLDDMKNFGFEQATLSGVSISYTDIVIPGEKEEKIEETKKEVNTVSLQYQQGFITDQERYNKVIDLWTETSEKVATMLMDSIEKDNREGIKINPIYMMAISGARGSKQQIRQLGGMRGLMAKPSGDIVEFPILSSFLEGLSVLEYFISTHGARKGLADTALKTADSGYLTRRLVDATQDVIISEEDCGAPGGIEVSGIIDGDSEVVSLKERILGRTLAEDVATKDGEILFAAGSEINDVVADKIKELGLLTIKIRSPLSCVSKRGVCAQCYGVDLARGVHVEMGTAVGIIAAQSIGEPGTQLTMRTFHVGGTASRFLEDNSIEVKESGRLEFAHLRIVTDKDKKDWVLNRNGEISILDDSGQLLEKHVIPSGAEIFFKEGDSIKAGETLAQWDIHMIPIIAEDDGIIHYEDLVEGETLERTTDALVGVERLVVSQSRENYFPQIVIKNKSGQELSTYALPAGAYISVTEGQEIKGGDVVAKFVRKISKTSDIVGGLERVAEMFEARKPKNPAVVSEIDGVVSFGGHVRGLSKVIVTSDAGTKKEYLIPHNSQLLVYKGDYISSGTPLSSGPIVLQDVLRVTGVKALQDHLVNAVHSIYRLQGVIINDKHIEVVVRQMLKKVRIEDVGDSDFLLGTLVDKVDFMVQNEELIKAGKKPAKADPVLLGITRSSLATDSFIAAASFQETTKVLTKAAISGGIDYLYGQKENVVLGSLIPSGTAFRGSKYIK